MTSITNQLDSFREFALARIQTGKGNLSMDELFDEWRIANPDPDSLREDALAVASSLRDLERGVPLKSPEEIIRKLKSRLPNE